MASLVRDQTREFGSRMALGATPARPRGGPARTALVAGPVAAVGLAAALLASPLLASPLLNALLFDVSPTYPIAIRGASLVLLAVAAATAYRPARRATATGPARTLRTD